MNLIVQHEAQQYQSRIWIKLRTGFRILHLAVGMTIIFIGTVLSLIILTNCYLGDNKEIALHAVITDYRTTTSKGLTKYYIKIKDSKLDKVVELRVNKPYEVGQQFNKNIQIGYWGFALCEEIKLVSVFMKLCILST